VSSATFAVGPAAADPVPPSPAAQAASPDTPAGASASQTVSGTVASTTGVAVTGGEAVYRGSEPAIMTVTHRGSQGTVTVVPR